MLKIAVAIMTTLLIIGIVALVYGMARQAAKLGTAPSALSPQYLYGKNLILGQGELKSVSASDGLIVLHWQGEANDTIVTIQGRDGRELGRIQVPRR